MQVCLFKINNFLLILLILGFLDHTSNCCAVGKPYSCGGFKDYESSTAEGVFVILDYLLKDPVLMNKLNLSCSWKDKTFCIQVCLIKLIVYIYYC